MNKLDTALNYETPEGIVLKLKIAGPLARAYAWAIDFFIRIGAMLAIASLFGYFGKAGIGMILVLSFLMEWFYPVFFEVYSGATPGKKIVGLSVVHDNGTPVYFASSALRNLLRVADFFPLFYCTGLISMSLNSEFKRLGDMAAGTLVVYKEKSNKLKEIKKYKAKQPPADLRVNEQQIILDFAERHQSLSKERCIELAQILYGFTGKRGSKAVEEIYSYANWLAKGK
ncbi:MAG: RDD family protein [Desulfobacteraceae bacterium]|nr:RDD family protein [Desulfobacteraceae bacterium]